MKRRPNLEEENKPVKKIEIRSHHGPPRQRVSMKKAWRQRRQIQKAIQNCLTNNEPQDTQIFLPTEVPGCSYIDQSPAEETTAALNQENTPIASDAENNWLVENAAAEPVEETTAALNQENTPIASDAEDNWLVENAAAEPVEETTAALNQENTPIASDAEDNWLVENAAAEPAEETISDETDFVNIRHGFREFSRLAKHSRMNCGIEHFKIVGSKQIGLKKIYTVKCEMCQYEDRFHCMPEDDTIMDINRAAVSVTMICGGGYNQLQEFVSAIDASCMSKKMYLKCEQEIIDGFERAAQQEMEDAGKLEKELAVERGDIHPDSNIPWIPVVADGSWMKRSYRGGDYNSLSGVGAIVGYHTKKVLYIGVKNKFCSICNLAAKKGTEAREHRCFKNWSRHQSSTGMESAAIVEGFKSSINMHGLIYSILVADGDSSVYKKILDNDPYKEYMVQVRKIECTNHILRNFCRKINEIVGKGRYKELRNLVKQNIIRLRTGIKKAAEYRSQENLALIQKINNLKIDLKNVPSHVFGEHRMCEKLGYFCTKYTDTNITNYVPQLRHANIYQSIEEAMQPLFIQAESLLYGLNNNAVECFNNIIAKFIGGKRINFGRKASYQGRVSAAVVQFNSKEVLSKLSAVMDKEPSPHVKKMEERRQRAREIVARHKKAAKTSSSKYGRQSCDKDYGPNAEKPDMDEETFISECDRHMETLRKWQTMRQEIEAETRDQAKSDKWTAYRKKLLTASHFGKICRLRKDTPRANTIKSILYPQLEHLSSIQYGQDSEKIALDQLQQVSGTSIMSCGLFIDATVPYLGATPDGIMQDGTIIEIKCPESAKNLSPIEAIEQLPAIKRIYRGDSLNKNHHYYYQVQGQLHIANREKAFFCLWTRKGFKITEVWRDDQFWAVEMEEKLRRFYEDYMLPEIVDSRYTRGQSIRELPYVKI